jgi:hypothetical protein
VISVITITGIGDHLQPVWLITFTGMRKNRHRKRGCGAQTRDRVRYQVDDVPRERLGILDEQCLRASCLDPTVSATPGKAYPDH